MPKEFYSPCNEEVVLAVYKKKDSSQKFDLQKKVLKKCTELQQNGVTEFPHNFLIWHLL